MSSSPTPSAARSPGTGVRSGPLAEWLVHAVRERPWVVDVPLAVGAFTVGLLLVLAGGVAGADRPAAIAVGAAAAVPLAWRRRRPLPAALAVTAAAVVSQLLLTGTITALVATVLVAGYSAVAYGPPWAGRLTAAVMTLGMVLPSVRTLVTLGPAETSPPPSVLVVLAVFGLLVGTCTWFAGALRRAHLRSAAQLRERARLLEEGRRREVRLELLAERSRISREVHDVVAHSLSGIIALADGGRYAATRDPHQAVSVLAGIAETGRDALGDIRGLLSSLRSAAGDTDADQDPRLADDARPGIDDVAVLVEQIRAGGLPVVYSVHGAPRVVTSGVGLAVYRVVQESLTNVVKHAGPATATEVGLGWGADEIEVVVRDTGASGVRPSLPRGGYGLTGMRERAALLGGTLDAGPRPDGGFAVRLRLPLTAAAAPTSAAPAAPTAGVAS